MFITKGVKEHIRQQERNIEHRLGSRNNDNSSPSVSLKSSFIKKNSAIIPKIVNKIKLEPLALPVTTQAMGSSIDTSRASIYNIVSRESNYKPK